MVVATIITPIVSPLAPIISPIVTADSSLFEARLRLTLVAALLPALTPRGSTLRRRFVAPRPPRLGR